MTWEFAAAALIAGGTAYSASQQQSSKKPTSTPGVTPIEGEVAPGAKKRDRKYKQPAQIFGDATLGQSGMLGMREELF